MSYKYDYAVADNAEKPHVEVYISKEDGTDHETVCIIPIRDVADDSIEIARIIVAALKRS